MHILRFIFDRALSWYLYTAACALGLCLATERLLLGHDPALYSPLHLFLFGGALCIYNLPNAWHSWSRDIRWNSNQLTLIIGFILAIASSFQLDISVLLLSAACGCLAVAYSIPVIPLRSFRRLRDIGWIKTAVLSSAWTTATAVIPFVYHHRPVTAYPFELAQRWAFIFILCLLFDIRDAEADERGSIITLPVKWGLVKTYVVIIAMLALYILFGLLQFVNSHELERLLMNLVTAGVLAMIIKYLSGKASQKAFSVLADGIMLLYAALILI